MMRSAEDIERIQNLEAENAALAAHAEELHERLKTLHVHGRSVANLDSRLATLLCLKPEASLARRDAEKQAEALDGVAMEWRRDEMDQNHTDCVEYLEKKAASIRRQAEAEQ